MSIVSETRMPGIGVRYEFITVPTEKHGRTRHCYLGPRGLEDVGDWVEAYRRTWADRFDRLDEIIERKKGSPK